MQTKSIVQSSANVVRVTNISAGDVYKRFETGYDDRTYYGVVKAVHNDGQNTVVEAVEYRQSYSGLDIAFKIIHGDKDVVLFPSSPEELNLELDGARDKKLRDIEEAENKIKESKKIIAEIDGLISGDTLKGLKAMSYKELSQTQYEEKMQALASM